MEANDNIIKMLSKWYAALDPDKPVDPSKTGPFGADDYVDFDKDNLRGSYKVNDLITKIKISANIEGGASAQLFAGFRGTGKSTELHRVKRLLADEGGFSVLLMDVGQYHNKSKALSIEELVLVIAAGIGEQAEKILGLVPLKTKTIWDRIKTLLSQEAQLKEISLTLGPVNLKALLHQGGDFKDKLKQLLRDKPDVLKHFLHNLVTEIAADIAPRQLVVLVDGLDKYYAPTQRIGEIYSQMGDLFYNYPSTLHLPRCHVVYTVPPYLAFLNQGVASQYGGQLYLLPSIKVHQRPPDHEKLHQKGIDALEKAISTRVDLDTLFGDERSRCITLLAKMSGGHIRDMCQLTQEVISSALNAGIPIGESEVKTAIEKLSAAKGGMFKETKELLQEMHEGGSLSSLSKDRFNTLAVAMDQWLVLCYGNGSFWYDVHPLVRSQVLNLE